MDDRAPVIAIDGPSASGKGTIASRVADALDFHYLESGALYRLVALESVRKKIAAEKPLSELARRLPVNFHNERIILSDQDVTDAIRSEEVGVRASEVARIAEVRKALLQRQRSFRQPPGLVADGRDMGTVVFPDAALKVFLTASPEERARRRHKQLMEKGISANMDDLLRDIEQRDQRDRERSAAPLRPASDAIQLDTSNLSIAEATDVVLAFFRQALTTS